MCARYYLMMLFCLSFTACTTLSKEECLQSDWYGIGQRDGAAGIQGQSRLSNYQQTCEQHNIAFDSAQYLAGVELGLQTYCNKDQGFSLGSSGKAYDGICQNHEEKTFLHGYANGLAQARCRTRQEVDNYEQVLKELRSRSFTVTDAKARKQLEADINDTKSQLLDARNEAAKVDSLYSQYSEYRVVEVAEAGNISDEITEAAFDLGFAVLSEKLGMDECQ